MAVNNKEAKRQKFEAAWDAIREELIVHLKSTGMPKDAEDWFGSVRVLDSQTVVILRSHCRTWTTMFLVESSTEDYLLSIP